MKSEVIKHSAAVQIGNTITLLQRQTWNVLLAYAYDDLPRADVVRHSIPVETLMDELQITTRNVKHLKEALRVLTTTAVEWNVLDRDNQEEWGVMGMLAEAKIKRGECTYVYSPTLRERLYSPRIYAKVKLAIQCKFSSKHALAVYELVCDYRGVGRTPMIVLDEFKRLTDTTGEGYASFSEFRRRVLDVAVAEINKRSDLTIEPVFERGARGRVEKIQFLIRAKQKPEPPGGAKPAARPGGERAFRAPGPRRPELKAAPVPATPVSDGFDLEAEMARVPEEERRRMEAEARASLGMFANDLAVRAVLKDLLRARPPEGEQTALF